MKLLLTNFSLKRPWIVVALTLVATIFFGMQFPKVHFDNDPENMLSASEPVRLFHHEVKERFDLYDFVIVGVVNEKDPAGVFNVGTLGRVYDLTGQLLSLRQGTEGKPLVTMPEVDGRAAKDQQLDLTPESAWERLLGVAFNHDPNRLFNEEGGSVIISKELIAPSVVDNIKQAELGSLKLEYLMEHPPKDAVSAKTIRDDAMNNPLYAGTMVSEDEKAVCIYIPITEKKFSYNVANLVRTLTADWPAEDQVYITGLPVAEDTFGVEMLVQMATSAPMAGVMIFLLLLFFFRRFSLIIAPMMVAVFSVVCTMGLLIGLGYDVHIMSSMIAIFLMPIAVADSVHVLSEFFDTYHKFNDRAKTVQHVVGHLFRPMLYTSLTTIAGFASLATTPIPPVQVFGLHVAFGVGLAWFLTMTFVPAYIMLFVPQSALDSIATQNEHKAENPGGLTRFLETLGIFSYNQWKLIVSVTLLVIIVSIYGIGKISVNDNPVKWFTADHEIRKADDVLNAHFGGTYTAYLTFAAAGEEEKVFADVVRPLKDEAQAEFGSAYPDKVAAYAGLIDRTAAEQGLSIREAFARLAEEAATIDQETSEPWGLIADEVNYLDAEGLTLAKVKKAIATLSDVPQETVARFNESVAHLGELTGADLQENILGLAEEQARRSFRLLTERMEAELNAPLFKRPEVLRYLEELQADMLTHHKVGKSTSAVEALKKASYELQYTSLPEGIDEPVREAHEIGNQANFSIPRTAAAVGQVYVQLEGMKKKDSLFHLVTRDYEEANVWVQLKSGDNKDMEEVVAEVREYLATHQPPVPLRAEWAGLTYLNIIWQEKMVSGMLTSLISSFAVVLVMMSVLFRSVIFGLLAMIPLSVTIAFIYGLIGLVGKDYDMPVAVLSALTLGLSVDFAIHFLERARELQKEKGSWKLAVRQMFKEPAMAISRNAITISIGFTPLLLAPLVPYRTVGFFLATIMGVSWLATLFILPALLTVMKRAAFGERDE